MDRGAWQTAVHGVARELDVTEATEQRSVQFNRSVTPLCIHSAHIVNPNLPVSPPFPSCVLLYILGSMLSDPFVGW